LFVLGPAVAKRHLGGPAAWAGVLVAIEAGVIASGIVLLRWKPRRILAPRPSGRSGSLYHLIALHDPSRSSW